ncbi:hypothetical protein [Methanosphaera sp. WGK6]|uniref:hypothetical protein n=1 Tax=Methanosphaera sp. WGK6 TaxID=1561964 RepID=UPI00084BE66A|nr:hypothetical protein [Methanosphaera sp. WGK6]OED29706.1 hypothetical protein NL43_06900 [Methanosphaera sp. WGK6]
MDHASILAIVILIIAILILVFYYLQSTNNPVYRDMYNRAEDFSERVGQEEYVSNFAETVNRFGDKLKDRVQDDEEEYITTRTDAMSKKINQFINEQSEQVIEDWNLTTQDDLDIVIDKYNTLEKDLNEYKEITDKRVDSLEERVNKIDEQLKNME